MTRLEEHMRKQEKLPGKMRVLYSMAALMLAVVVMLFCDGLSIVSSAAGQGTVTKSSVSDKLIMLCVYPGSI